MTYTIDWLEVVQTSTGKTKANVTLVGEDGGKIPDVSIWGDFANFNELRPGSKVEGVVTYKPYKGKNYASLGKAMNPNGTYAVKPKSDIAKAVAAKNENIAHSQEKKMEGIKDSSTFRAATDHVIQWRAERLARGEATSTEEWQQEWINVRKWFDARFSEPFSG